MEREADGWAFCCSERSHLLFGTMGHQEHVRIVYSISWALSCFVVLFQMTNLWGKQLFRIMIFIITILLLAADFYYLKNIAGRRLVGLRWWNEVDPQTGESQWVFESLEPGTRVINATDSRFFWLALYVQPVWWILMAILAIIRLQFLWLPLVGEFSLFLFHPVGVGFWTG